MESLLSIRVEDEEDDDDLLKYLPFVSEHLNK